MKSFKVLSERRSIRTSFVLFSATVLLSACQGDLFASNDSGSGDTTPIQSLTYQVPEIKEDALAVTTLTDVGVSPSDFNLFINELAQKQYSDIDGLAIAKSNQLIYEHTFRQTTGQYDEWINNVNVDLHAMHSVSKSVTAILIGIALEQGYISSIGDSVLSYFPEISVNEQVEQKQRLSILDLLTMRAGMTWDEFTYPYGDSRNSLSQLVVHEDWTQAFFNLPMEAEPGSKYAYNTGATNVLMELLDKAVPQGAEAFANQVLFQPLSMSQVQWDENPKGVPVGGSGLYLDLRGAIKLGLLMSNHGVFEGQRIVGQNWISAMVESETVLDYSYTSGYGLQWWLGFMSVQGTEYPYYSARGFGSQFVVVVPSLELVIVTFGQNYTNDKYFEPLSMIETKLLPLFIGSP